MSNKIKNSNKKIMQAGEALQNAVRVQQKGVLVRFARRANPFIRKNSTDIEIIADSEPEATLGKTSSGKTSSGMSGYTLTLLCFVIIPAIAISLYYAFLASNQFYAETRFAVRKASFSSGSDTKSALSSLSSGSMPALASQDAYIITSYIHSRSILQDLSKTINIHAIYTRPEADFWAKLQQNASDEELLKYWSQMVTTYIDGPSGIVTVGVRSFRREDSLELANAIIKASEKLANDVSTRIKNDAVERASGEVRRSEAMVITALTDLKNFRNSEGYIDPSSAAQSKSKLLLDLLSQKIQLQNDLFVSTRAMSENAPTLVGTKNRLVALDSQIDSLRSQLTNQSGEKNSLASSLTQYEQLDLKRLFAEKLYSLSQDGLESAKRVADNQGIYVSVFVPPALPDESTFPKRLSFSVIAGISLLAIWGILALLAAAVDDHQF
jgi:capsular polysaccharide transport system permease protein